MKQFRSLFIAQLILAGFLLLFFLQCSPFDPGMGFGSSRFSVYYTEPGTDRRTGIDKQIDAELVKIIDAAEETVRLAVYNFSLDSVIQAVVRAKNRRIDVKLIGDIDEYYTHGYQEMEKNNVDMHLGNATGIMHDKFCIVDGRILFVGTGNITSSDFVRNNNNFFIIEHADLAQVYEREFMQMYNGLFAVKKKPRSLNQKFNINQGSVEVFFSPYQGTPAMASLIDLVEEAKNTIHFMIFAYTHDELAAAMVRASRQRNVSVYGVHDSTFIIGVSEEAPRLHSSSFNNDASQNYFGPFVKIDGNENTMQEGNPVHGGKMHAKTMIIDAGTENAIVATGSFNWSTNAVDNNDESMLIIRDARIANALYEQWQGAWEIGQPMNDKIKNKNGQGGNPQDVIISEVNWAGAKDNNTSVNSFIDENDDFIELYNRSSQAIDISHWSIQWGCDDKKNIYPLPDQYNWFYDQDNILDPGEHVLLFNITNSAFAASYTGGNGSATTAPHFKFSGTKDFILNSAELKIRLYDKSMKLIDEAGNCQNAPAGFQDNDQRKVASMQRRNYKGAVVGNGSQSGSWYSATSVCNSVFNSYCFDFNLNTFATPGYNNDQEIGPNIIDSFFVDQTHLRLDFDSNMQPCTTISDFVFRKEGLGNFTPTQIQQDTSDLGRLIVESTQLNDQSKIIEILPKGVIHQSFISGSQIFLATNSGLAISTDLSGSVFNFHTRISSAGVVTNLASPRINALLINGSDIFLATATGLSRSDLSGNFQTAGAGYPAAALNDLIFSGTMLYLASENGIYYSSDSFASNSSLLSTLQGLGSNKVKKLFLITGAPNKILAATENGLAIIDASNQTITNKTTANGLPSNNILSVFYDGSAIFVGTDQGLARSTDDTIANNWQIYNSTNGLPSNNISAIYVNGNDWLIGSHNGLAASDNNGVSFTVKNQSQGLKGLRINHIHLNASKIYLSTMAGLAISNNISISHNYSTLFACTDYSNRYSPHNYLYNADFGFYLNGYNTGNSGQLAQLKINEVAMQRSNDFIEMYVTQSGSLRGLSIYKFSGPSRTQLYQFNEAHVVQGEYILLELKHSYTQFYKSEDRTQRRSANLIRSYSTYKGLDGTDDIIILQDAQGNTQDFLYYSNRSGDIAANMINEALRDVYYNYQAWWPLPEIPTDGLNDALIQTYGIDISNVNSSTRGIQRSCNGSGVWEFSSSLTPGAANLSPNC